jgi:hypothetical protein
MLVSAFIALTLRLTDSALTILGMKLGRYRRVRWSRLVEQSRFAAKQWVSLGP